MWGGGGAEGQDQLEGPPWTWEGKFDFQSTGLWAFNPEYSLAPSTASYLPPAAFFLQICSQHDPGKYLARPLTVQAGLGQGWRAWQAGAQGESGAGGSAPLGPGLPTPHPLHLQGLPICPPDCPTTFLGEEPQALESKTPH